MNRILKLAQTLQELGFDEEAEAVEDLSKTDWEAELGQEPYEEKSFEESEQEYFGHDFDILKQLTQEANSNKGQKNWGPFNLLGWGSFRRVYQIKGRYDYVIKVASSEDGAVMNQSEFHYQQNFEGLFPKVYKHGTSDVFGTDYDWMIIERVDKLRGDNQLNEFFPYIYRIINLTDGKHNRAHNNVYDFFFDYSLSLRSGKPINRYYFSVPKIAKLALKNEPLFMRLEELRKDIGIEIGDMKPANLGINSNGQFVILDASILGKELKQFRGDDMDQVEKDDQVRFDQEF